MLATNTLGTHLLCCAGYQTKVHRLRADDSSLEDILHGVRNLRHVCVLILLSTTDSTALLFQAFRNTAQRTCFLASAHTIFTCLIDQSLLFAPTSLFPGIQLAIHPSTIFRQREYVSLPHLTSSPFSSASAGPCINSAVHLHAILLRHHASPSSTSTQN